MKRWPTRPPNVPGAAHRAMDPQPTRKRTGDASLRASAPTSSLEPLLCQRPRAPRPPPRVVLLPAQVVLPVDQVWLQLGFLFCGIRLLPVLLNVSTDNRQRISNSFCNKFWRCCSKIIWWCCKRSIPTGIHCCRYHWPCDGPVCSVNAFPLSNGSLRCVDSDVEESIVIDA